MEFRGTAETREHPKPMVSTVRIMVVPRQWVGHFLNAGLLLYFSFPPLPSPLSSPTLLPSPLFPSPFVFSLRRLSGLCSSSFRSPVAALYRNSVPSSRLWIGNLFASFPRFTEHEKRRRTERSSGGKNVVLVRGRIKIDRGPKISMDGRTRSRPK